MKTQSLVAPAAFRLSLADSTVLPAFKAGVARTLRNDAPMLVFYLAYTVIAISLLVWSFDGAAERIFVGFPTTFWGHLTSIGSVTAFWTLIYLVRNRPRRPALELARVLFQPDVWPRVASRLMILAPATALLTLTFSAMKAQLANFHAFSFDVDFIALDAFIHGGHQPWELLQPVIGHPVVTHIIDRMYYFWFPIMFMTFYWQVFSTRRPVVRLQFLLSFGAAWALIGTAAAIALSSAGPAFLANLGMDASAYQGLFAYLKDVTTVGEPLLSQEVRELLWRAYSMDTDLPLKGITAMPSMHVTIATLLALLGWRINRYVGIAYTIFAVTIFIGSVHLGYHYAVDGYVAVAMIVAIWLVAGRVARWWLQRTGSAAALQPSIAGSA